jgi:hypothetical protein
MSIFKGRYLLHFSEEYAYLDSDTQKKKALGAKRHHRGDYPDLKAALFVARSTKRPD